MAYPRSWLSSRRLLTIGCRHEFFNSGQFYGRPRWNFNGKTYDSEMARESKEEQDFKIEIEKHTNVIEAPSAAVEPARMALAINVDAGLFWVLFLVL